MVNKLFIFTSLDKFSIEKMFQFVFSANFVFHLISFP